MSVTIDAAAFRRRLHILQRELKESKHFEGVGALLTMLGKGTPETQGIHATVFHVWMMGYPFANTAIAISADRATIVTSAKQAKYIEHLRSSGVEIMVRPKDAEESREAYTKVLDVFAVSGRVARFEKDEPSSPLADVWTELLKERATSASLEWVDATTAFETLLHAKDEDELRAIRTASKASLGVMTSYLADEMAAAIDEGKQLTHAAFSNQVSNMIDNERLFKQFRLGSEFDPSFVDWASQPLIQSGGKFDLSEGAVSNKDLIQTGVIYTAVSLRYRFYTSLIARTYLIDVAPEIEQQYNLLLNVQKRVFGAIADGKKCSEIYNTAEEFIKQKDESLLPKFKARVGYGIGIQPHEQGLDLTKDNHTVLRDGMTLCVSVAFEDLVDVKGVPYVLALADTARVAADQAIIFTDSPRSLGDIAFTLAKEADDSKQSKSRSRAEPVSSHGGRHTRSETREVEEFTDQRIQRHQNELKEQLNKRGLAKYAGDKGQAVDENKAVFKKYESYKRETQLPNLKELRITLDQRAQTIIVPISGRPVPFHINSYKNGSKNEEDDYVYLRLNFNSPDVGIGKREDVPFENAQATFLKSITLRSRDTDRMNDTFRKIQDMKREATRRETERKEMADVVQQDKLIEIRDRRPLRLEPLYIRPMPEGKRVAGTLEIHKNGVRYHSPLGKDQQVDVLFSNIEHLFFQPSDEEMIVLIHLYLKQPIMIGKRKTQNVQFYRDATDVTYDDTGNKKRRYRYGDEDELEQEQEERRMRAALNKAYKGFAEQISKASNGKLDVDIPFRELGFQGTPFRSSVFLQPTTECLVQLVETPFLVIQVADVELAYLERVQFGLQEFDLVFIYKDYTRPVTQINTIPVEQMDSVKDWLNEMDIPFYEGPVNMKWSVVMKTILADPNEFFETGGWSFLGPEDEDGEGAGSQAEEISDYQASDDDPQDESDSFSEESEGYSEESGSTEEESGEDWDELEKEAAEEDSRARDRRRR